MAAGVTLSDVAREAGVSLATASRAINGSATRTVRPELRERVLAAAARLHYTPDASAQAMARGRTTLVGLVAHDLVDPYFGSFADGVTAAAARSGLQVGLASTRQDHARVVEVVHRLHEQRARAIILSGVDPAEGPVLDDLRTVLDDYRADGGAVVAIGASLLDVPVVPVCNPDGPVMLARELYRLGYRRPAVLAGPPESGTLRERADAFVAEWVALGGSVDPAAVVSGHAGLREDGDTAMRALVATGVRFDLVFAVTDLMVIGVLTAALSLGVRIPEDCGLAGHDDIPLLGDVIGGVTTVHVPLVEVGEAALALALGGIVPEIRPWVVLRASTPPR